MDQLVKLAQLIKTKNEIDDLIADCINRPALTGHIGEYIASCIFDIQLESSANNQAVDGVFRSGHLEGKTVNIKFYGKEEHILDITPDVLPDFYLVLTGPRGQATSSLGKTRPFIIQSVFLFDAKKLLEILRLRNIKIGVATSVIKSLWEDAQIYPEQHGLLQLTQDMRNMLSLFKFNNT